MNQPLEYMRHRAKCAASNAQPLTYHQWLRLTDKLESMK